MGSGLAKIAAVPGSEEWGKKVRLRARELIRVIDRGYIELAEIIHAVWSTPIDGQRHNASICVAWGYRNYVQWGEEELGLDRRKIERLKAIWHHLHVTLEGELTPRIQRRIIAVGWTKVRELIRVIDASNVERWVELAENLTYNELCEAIRRALADQEKDASEVGKTEGDEWKGADPPEDVGRFKEFRLYLSPEQLSNVDAALKRAGQLASSAKKGHLIDLICTDFLSTNDFGKSDDPEAVLRLFAKLERLTGKRLVVIDPTTWEINYGMEALSKAADAAEAAGRSDEQSDIAA